MVWEAVAGAAASAAADFLGARYAQRKSEALTREQMAWNAKQAQINRDFQERMSSTAYQRSAKDLEAAGLNRILALGSPASSPAGNLAAATDLGSSAQALSELGKSGTKAVQTGLAIANAKQAIDTSRSLARNYDSQTDLNNARTVVEQNKGTVTDLPADAIDMTTDWIKENVGVSRETAAAILGAAGFGLTFTPAGRVLSGAKWAITNAPKFLAWLGKTMKRNEVRTTKKGREVLINGKWKNERELREIWERQFGVH